ncbi:MAG TPA: SlyX family protein [Opitutaceae bacterium]|jgi:uncharacterized coiled-coil protein SlyX
MNPDPIEPLAKRSIELEARFAWLERHVAEQDKVMLELGDEVRRLKRETNDVRKRLDDASEAKPVDEHEPRPPHY